MGELIKCSGRGCCEKNSCYRYLASTATWQLWFTQPPVNRSYPCPHYWQCHRGDCATERSLGRRATG